MEKREEVVKGRAQVGVGEGVTGKRRGQVGEEIGRYLAEKDRNGREGEEREHARNRFGANTSMRERCEGTKEG